MENITVTEWSELHTEIYWLTQTENKNRQWRQKTRQTGVKKEWEKYTSFRRFWNMLLFDSVWKREEKEKREHRQRLREIGSDWQRISQSVSATLMRTAAESENALQKKKKTIKQYRYTVWQHQRSGRNTSPLPMDGFKVKEMYEIKMTNKQTTKNRLSLG